MTGTLPYAFEPPSEERLKEAHDLIRYESSVSFHSTRAKETMLILLSEARAARALRVQAEKNAEELRFLSALEAAGVDNWSGYDHAVEICHADD